MSISFNEFTPVATDAWEMLRNIVDDQSIEIARLQTELAEAISERDDARKNNEILRNQVDVLHKQARQLREKIEIAINQHPTLFK